ncbi:MAG TPA: pitrilysin family protein [Thermoanaerobaculia bacterium]|nr:pitrilysin family protein [Thermoanaerobaculia bacterium]
MKRFLLSFLFALPLLAQQVAPPAPAAPREAKLPQPVEKTLANGLRVIVVPKHDIPLVAVRLFVRGGAAQDPPGRDGLAELTATVLTKGTKTRTAEQIARGVEALGATLAADADWDATSIDLSVMSSNLPKALDFVSDVARNATFPKEELERERAQAIDALQVDLSEPRPLAQVVASRLVFGETPYGHNLSGLPSTLSKITRADVTKFYARSFNPNNAVLVLAGDIASDDAFRLADANFGKWANVGRASARPAEGQAARPASSRIVVIDMPESGQAAVVVARRGIRRSDPAYMQALVANSILGGGYSSRLNQEIRIKRGLSYGAGSSFDSRADVGPFRATTQTKHESAAEVAGIITGEMSRLGNSDVLDAELTPRKAALTGEFAQSLETTSGIVNRISALALYGLPLTDINRYISGVNAVTAEEVRKFATSNLGGKDVTVVVAGDAKQFLEPLKKQFADVEVINVADLDLASPTLRVRKAKN